MGIPFEYDFGNVPVRFTSDGRVFVEDAIKVLSCDPDEKPDIVWEKMKNDYPDILEHCHDYNTMEGSSVPTINIEGLDEILRLLPEYIEFY